MWKFWIFGILLVAIFVVGCGEANAPSAPQNESTGSELWNPDSGYEIEPGRDIPMVDDNYWESIYGQQTNPWLLGTIQRIGLLGGIVRLGYHSYQIPAGALLGPLFMTMSYASLNAVAVDCGPSPLTFLLPVTLTLSYRNTQYDADGADPSGLQIWYMQSDGTFAPMGGVVDQNSRTVRAQVTHFSRYILG